MAVTINDLMDNLGRTLVLIEKEYGSLDNLEITSNLMHKTKCDKFYEGYYSVQQIVDAMKNGNIKSLDLENCILVTQAKATFICKHY